MLDASSRGVVFRSKLREHVGLLIILLVFLAAGILYLRTTPLLETPDEPSHFSVVKYIADELRLPPAQSAPTDAGPIPLIREGPPVYYAPPLYYAVGALVIADMNTSGFAQGVIPNPNWARGWAPTVNRSPDNKHIYILTDDQRAPLAGWAAAMVRLRAFSLLLGGATVAGVYALARAVWSCQVGPARSGRIGLEGPALDSDTASTPGQSWVLAATALVAFNPGFLFVTTGVTNDALLFALSTWASVLMVQLVLRGSGRRSTCTSLVLVLLLGIVLGLAVLTKQSALALLPVAALAVVWGARCQPQPRRTTLIWLLLMAGLIALLAGWWYLHNTLTYGDVLGFQPHQTPEGKWWPTTAQIVRQLSQALQGYWAVFGWGLIQVEPAVYVVVAFFALAGLIGLLTSLLYGRLRRGSNTERRVVVILGLAVLLNFGGLVLWLWRTSAPYGRLLYPTLGPLAVLLVLGWQHWLGQRFRRAFACVVILAVALFAFVVPWRYLRPAYADPLVSPSAVAAATPVDVQFDKTLHLLGYQMTPEDARPGDQATFTLYWQAQNQIQIPLTVFVQLAANDPEQHMAGSDDYLGSSHYPSHVWQPGETIRQVHRLQLPEDMPAPGLYWFTVGLYGEADKTRLPVIADGAAVPDGVVRLGPLRVLSRKDQQPAEQVDYRLDSAIRLTGYDVELPAISSSGEPLPDAVTVTLFWNAIAVPESDLVVFVHLLDADGKLVAQHDGPPRQGEFPTWGWRDGDYVPDSHMLLLPTELKPGTYRLLVGMYRRNDGTRLPIFDEAGQRVPDDALILTELNLAEGNE